MKKLSSIANSTKLIFLHFLLILIARPLTADVWTVRTPSRAANEPNWNAHYDSDHFAVWYSSQFSCTESQAKTGLDQLEKVFDFYVNQKKFATKILNRSTNYKVNCCIIESGLYGGLDGQGNPTMWIGVAGLNDKWGLAHEFTHALQGVTGGFNGSNGNVAGWFWESHANWMPHQLYPDNPHCSEMYVRMSNLYYGSHRCRYCNWQFLEYLKEKKSIEFINNLWTSSSGDVLETMMKTGEWDLHTFGDIFADFATKNVTWDYQNGAVYRSVYGTQSSKNKHRWYTYLQEIDTSKNRYSVPFEFAPQRYGYNLVRLYPQNGASTVTVRFRGCVQTENANPSYKKANQWEPQTIKLPGSDWRYALVAVTAPGKARYSDIKRFSDNAPDLTFDISGATEVYLVVAATPKVYSQIIWDQMYYTIYRYPWMVEITGAKPQGFEPVTATGKTHANGGGFVANTATVASTAYVGPFARVLGGKVQENARIEDRAIVKGGTISGNAIVKDNAMVAGGTVSGSAVIADNAAVWDGSISGNGRADGCANVSQITVRDSGHIGGNCWVLSSVTLSGNAKMLGDGEIVASKSKGVHYGLIDISDEGNVGNSRTTPVKEVNRPGPFEWYEPDVSNNGYEIKRTFTADAPVRFEQNNGAVSIIAQSLSHGAKIEINDVLGHLVWKGLLCESNTVIPARIMQINNLYVWKLNEKNHTHSGKILITR